MKKMLAITLGLCLTAAFVSAAEREKKGNREGRVPPRALERFDKNGDGKLDDAEREAARKDREAREKELIAKYDKNGDGKLDQAERRAARADRQKDGKGGEKHGLEGKKEQKR